MEKEEYLEVEDSLQEAGVYRSMIDNTPRHMYSYGTITDYNRLLTWWNENKNKHTTDEWLSVVEYEDYYAYLSPNASLLASFILYQIGYIRDGDQYILKNETKNEDKYSRRTI